ncbi:unnamed protein product, partial [Cylicostephanus goldi]
MSMSHLTLVIREKNLFPMIFRDFSPSVNILLKRKEVLRKRLPVIVLERRRLNCARERRRDQLRKCDERERSLPPPRPRRQRLRFSPEVALLEATGRADAAEGERAKVPQKFVRTIERLLREGANPNSHNEDGLTPLHQCAIDDNQQ